MIDLIEMRPSEWREMPDKISNKKFRVELGEALVHFLKTCKNDEGSGADEVYMASLKLTNAGIWNYFKAKEAAKILKSANESVRSVFLDATPDDMRLKIQQELNSLAKNNLVNKKEMSRSKFPSIERRVFKKALSNPISKAKRIKNG